MQIEPKLGWLDPKHRQRFELHADPESAYLENVKLCKEWILPLRVLEEALRYRCVSALLAKHGERWWELLGSDISIRVNEVRLGRDGQELPWELWIDSLSFGFWTSLFNAKYEQKFWNPLHRHIFPNLPKSSRRKDLSPPLNELRNLRNDLFHHAVLLDRPILNKVVLLDHLMLWLGVEVDQFYRSHLRNSLLMASKTTSI